MTILLRIITFFVFISLFYTTQSQPLLLHSGQAGFQISDNSYTGFTISNQTGNLTCFEVKTLSGLFTELSVEGYGFSMVEGAPKLPVLKHLIEVPYGSGIKINITESDFTDIPLSGKGIENQVFPAQPPVSKGIDNPEELPLTWDRAVYNKNEFLGGDLVKVTEAGIMRGVRIFNFEVAPVQYNPVTRTLRVYYNLEAEVVFTHPDIGKTIAEKERVYSPFFNNQQLQLINYQPLETDELITSAPLTMVIVSDPAFQSTLQPFINWKKKKGFRIIEGYTNNPAVGTSTTSIKSWLQGLYQSPPTGYNVPTFVLLVGDVAQVPAFNGTAGSHPTDLYYMEYTGDKLPEVYYGRFSANNISELQPQIDKTLQYEQYLMPDPTFLDKAVIVAGADGTHQLTWGNGQVNYATTNYFNAAHGITASAYLQPLPSGAATQIKNEVSAGTGFANYSAHCSPDGWANPSFLNSDVPNLQNSNKYPLVVGNCCLSAKFNEASCFGETLMRAANKGSLGYIGGSNNTYWDEDYWWAVGFKSVSANPVYNAAKLGAFDRTFHDHGELQSDWYITQGQMTVGGNLAVQQSGSSMKTYYWEIYHLLGDPSLMVYYSQPDPTAASYQGLIPLGSATFEVNTSPFAYVGISKDNVVYGAAVANASGIATIALDPISVPGTANLVVTRQNGQPFIGTVEAASPAGAFITLDSYGINDETGNLNGIAEPGETVSLHVSLENLGTATAYNVQGVLSTLDEYIMIADNTESWPPINPGDISMQQNAFTFTVAGIVPDQHSATLELMITAGQEAWEAVINLTLSSAEVTFGSMTLLDGNDGILFPGESGTLKFSVQNTGSASITGAQATLSSSHPLFLISTPVANIGTIAPGQSLDILYQVSAAPNMLVNSLVPVVLNLNALNAGGSASFQTVIGADNLETFESGSFNKFGWQQGGNAPWTVVNSGAYQGTYCARSGVITHNQTSELSVTANVLNNDSIVFYFRVSSEASYDYLRFYIDNVEKAQWAGTWNYTRAAFAVSSGSHSFKWAYTKDVSVNTGSDCAWIDHIRFPAMLPNTPPQAAFMSDITSANIHQPVQFYDISSGNVGARAWTFEGGNPATSSELNPVVTYDEPGTYDVSLTVYNGAKSNTKTLTDYMTVTIQILQQVLEIGAGWHGISACLFPQPDSMETIMEPIADKLVLIQNMDEIYWPGVMNTLSIWDCEEGYKIKVTAPVSLPINGTQVYNRSLPVNAGWNLIPVLSACDVDIIDLFDPIRENLLMVSEVAGNGIYWPDYGINTLEILQPGKSYFAYFLQEGTLVFPPDCPNILKPKYSYRPEILSPWNTPDFYPGSHIIAFPSESVQWLQPYDVIGVFDQRGNCFGQQVYTGDAFALVSNGDDPFTRDVDGFAEKEPLYFRLFRPATQEQITLNAIFSHEYDDGFFRYHGISVVKSLDIMVPAVHSPTEFSFSVYPNPASSVITIESTLPVRELIILSPAGNPVAQMKSESSIGLVDISLLPRGLYILKCRTDNHWLYNKFVRN